MLTFDMVASQDVVFEPTRFALIGGGWALVIFVTRSAVVRGVETRRLVPTVGALVLAAVVAAVPWLTGLVFSGATIDSPVLSSTAIFVLCFLLFRVILQPVRQHPRS